MEDCRELMTVTPSDGPVTAQGNGNDSIPFLPPVPGRILTAAKRGKLVVFIGAGVSCIAGSPDWDGFANGMLKKEAEKGNDHVLSFAELDQIKQLNPKIKLFIARNTGNLSPDDYREILEPNKLSHRMGINVYQNLHAISNQIITTNYDSWLDEPLPALEEGIEDEARYEPKTKKVFFKGEAISPSVLHEEAYVVHLHGSLIDPENMIMTTADYIKHYKREDKNPVPEFLEELFRERVVLFIGYGLNELEILEYVLSKKGDYEHNHFMLQGFYSHQRGLNKHLSEYYLNECGVELIPYNMDTKGYESLSDVLDDWASRIRPKTMLPLDRRIELEGWLDDG